VADNLTTQSNGALPGTTQLRTRDTGSGHTSKGDLAPWVPTPIAGGQYALSVSTSSASALTVPGGATHAFISVDTTGGNIRWTRDGTTPTSAVGHLVQAGDALEIDNLSAFRMIAISTTGTVQVSYHKYV